MPDRPPIRTRLILTLAAMSGLMGVVMGAVAAHTLDPVQGDAVRIAAHYQSLHALALLATGILGLAHRSLWLEAAGWLFVAGILMFCGSLYLKGLEVTDVLGPVTPFGGAAFMLGWISLGLGSWRLGKEKLPG
jgi:uncharacterized membrane protein YgdD (TMEM256/DUF423 family)